MKWHHFIAVFDIHLKIVYLDKDFICDVCIEDGKN